MKFRALGVGEAMAVTPPPSVSAISASAASRDSGGRNSNGKADFNKA